MAGKRDYYEVLGVDKSASDRDITSAYRKLATKYHPDRNPEDADATQKFKEAAEAYEILSDKEKRARYDQYGHAGVDGSAMHSGSTEDIFEAFGELFGGGIFGDLFGGRRGNRVRPGNDVRADIALTLEEAATGIERDISFARSHICGKCNGSRSKPGKSAEKCRRCNGMGQVVQSAGILRVQTTCSYCQGTGQVISDPCDECRGSGLVRESVTIKVNIPPGVDDGMRVRIRGEGEPSPNGGPPGDCYCFVSIKRHKLFQRDGNNLLLRFPISYPQAALGATIEIPTLKGRHELQLAPGTQSGEVFRLRGQGMPEVQSNGRGDLLVEVFIEVPKKLNARQDELLRELAELDHANVTPHRKSILEKIRDYFTPTTEGE